MAGPDAVQFTHFEYDPEAGGFLEPGQPSEFAASLHEITLGQYAQAGSAVIDTETGRIVSNISRRGGTSLDIGTDGTILLNNVVTKAQLRNVMGTSAIPRALVTGDLGVLGAGLPTDVNRTITLAPQGQVIYVDRSKLPGKGAYSRVNTEVFGDGGPPLKNSLGELITADEMLVRGVAGWLSRNAPGVVDRLKLQGVKMPDGTTSVSGSDIVRAIAANISVTPVVTRVLREGGDVVQ